MPACCPLVSLILAARNAASCLGAALESVFAQTLEDFELLLLDDGSDDSGATLKLMREAGKDERVRVHCLWRKGLAQALNFGLSQARGKFIARMDADDLCHPERLAEQVKLLEKRPDIGVASCLVRFGGDRETKAGYARHVDWLNSLVEPDEISLGVFRDSPLAHPSVMFRSELPKLYGGYADGPFPEDFELWLRWFASGTRAAKVRREFLTWNDPPQRLSRTSPNYAAEAFHRIKAPYLAAWLAEHNPFHPVIHVMGAGRITRLRAAHLLEHGIEIKAWYDIDPNKIGKRVAGRQVLAQEDLPLPGQGFTVSYVSSAGAPELIETYLQSRGYQAGRDYILAG